MLEAIPSTIKRVLRILRGRPVLGAGIVLVLVAAVVTAAILVRGNSEEITWIPAEREMVSVEMIETGQVDAVSQNIIKAPEYGGNLQIIDIVPEGSHVSAGDIIAHFDDAEVRQNLEEALDLYDQALASYESVQVAQTNRKNDAVIEKQKAEYTLAAAEMRMQQLKYESTVRQEDARLEHQKTILSLEEMDKQQIAQELKDKIELNRARTRLTHAEDRVAYHREQIEEFKIKAPVDGMLVYLEIGGWGTPPHKIQVSDMPRPGQAIFTIPVFEDMNVVCRVNELDVARLLPGQPAKITLDAFEDTTFTGVVRDIAPIVEEKQEGFRMLRGSGTNAQDQLRQVPVFRVSIALNGVDPRLKPGLTAQARINVEAVDGAISVPRSVVFEDSKGQPVVFTKDRWPEPVPVTVGDRTPLRTVILDGLTEGDLVSATPPQESKTFSPGWFAEMERRRTEKAALLAQLDEMAGLGLTGEPLPVPEGQGNQQQPLPGQPGASAGGPAVKISGGEGGSVVITSTESRESD